MYLNKAGLLEGLLKVLKVAGYVAASGAVVALVDYLKNLDINPSNYILVAVVGLVNAGLAGLLKWLATKK